MTPFVRVSGVRYRSVSWPFTIPANTEKYFSFSRLEGFESQNSDDCTVLSQRAFVGLCTSILIGIIGIFVTLIIIATTTTTTTLTSHSYLYHNKRAPYS
jgi:hypothetical protein